MSRADEMRLECIAFHDRHPEVWQLFHQFAMEKVNLGFRHYGVSAVMERVRWETDAGGGRKEPFKINNNFRAFYARRFNRMHPEISGGEFFWIREQSSAHEGPREAARG